MFDVRFFIYAERALWFRSTAIQIVQRKKIKENKFGSIFLSLSLFKTKKTAIESQRDVLRSHIGRKYDCWLLEQQTHTHTFDVLLCKITFINCVPIIVNVDYNKAGGFGRRFSSVFLFYTRQCADWHAAYCLLLSPLRQTACDTKMWEKLSRMAWWGNANERKKNISSNLPFCESLLNLLHLWI